MCVVSMVGDFYGDKWREKPWIQPNLPYVPGTGTNPQPIPEFKIDFGQVSKEEFDALKKEVQDMKKLLERAVEYDKKNNEPNCEMEDKVALLKQVAKMVGVDLSEIFGK